MGDRYTLGWHDRGPLPSLPLVVDTWGHCASEEFTSEDAARAEIQEQNAAWDSFMAGFGACHAPIVRSLEPGQVWHGRDGSIRVDVPDYDYVTVTDLASGEQRIVQPTHFGTTYTRAGGS